MTDRPWLPHDGKACPVPLETRVDVRFRDGRSCEGGFARSWQAIAGAPDLWARAKEERENDIVFYRLAEPVEPTNG